jgi:hypothetical protein
MESPSQISQGTVRIAAETEDTLSDMQRPAHSVHSTANSRSGSSRDPSSSSRIKLSLIVGAVVIAAVTALVVLLDHWK